MPKKHSYDYIKQYFKDQGCELLEKEYKNNHTNMEYKCSCENVSKITFHNFQNGERCQKCAKQKSAQKFQHSYDYIKQYFKDQGCELLEKEYKNNYTKMEYKCSCENISEISFSNFQRGKRCQKCGHKKGAHKRKFSYDYIKQYFKDKECELLEKEYINCMTKMEYKCSCENISEISFSHFQQGERCQKCGIKKISGKNNPRWIINRQIIKDNQIFRNKCSGILHRCLDRINQSKINKTSILLGYTTKELKNYIQNHPNWVNVDKNNWHLDHIFPIQAFLDYDIKDIKLINCFDNLQPLSPTNNLSKHCKYDKQEFENWLKDKNVVYDK